MELINIHSFQKDFGTLFIGCPSEENRKKNGYFPVAFSIFVPLLNGLVVIVVSGFLTNSVGDRLLLTILAASASYIAVPAAMKMAAPKANPGLYIPMVLAITFPFNIMIGIPLYLLIIRSY